MYVVGAVLAAGSGVRMGGPKADLVVDGERLVDRAVTALATGGCDRVIAVVRARTSVAAAEPVVNSDPDLGMRSSLALAVDTARRLSGEAGIRLDEVGLAVLLVDTPGIGADAVRAVVDRWRTDPTRIAIGSFAGGRLPARRSHPTVMGLTRWPAALLLAAPDEGARAYLAANGALVDDVAVDGDPVDLDRPEDLHVWRERR